MASFSKEIKAYALKNALEFGKADAGKILPKLFQHGLKKEEIKVVMKNVQEIVKEVNSMKKLEQENLLKDYALYAKEREEKEERELPELPNAGKIMVFRLAPFPSGAMHIGNAKTYLLNALYAEKYKGKTLLVMDDTIGSEEKQAIPESYDLIEDAFKWLKVKYEKPIIYKSDRLKIYYKYAEELMKKDKAYVCTCFAEDLRKNRAEGKECICRQYNSKEQLKRWKGMFEAKEGHAVLRIKTDMMHPNPAFRDRVLFKISDRRHPRVGNKYRVWPTLEMSWSVDDHLLGITHILRGNDLMIETDMEKYIWGIFGWKHPETIHTGLVKIEVAESKISKSKAQKEVKSGKFTGWDDPRTWSMQSFARRGIKAEAVREFVKEIGLNKHDITIPVDSLYSINRKLIDKESNRYSFVENPVKLEIKNMPEIKNIDVSVHPDKEEQRKIKIKDIQISGKDYEQLKGKEIRLLHLLNINLKNNETEFTSLVNKNIPKINWVSEGVKARILMPDGEWIEGLAERAVEELEEGDIIQFERFGFVRFDRINKGIYEFWFAHG